MTISDTTYSCLRVFNKYNIPSDISKLIYYFIYDQCAQLIINRWFSYIVIHNTNLAYLVNNLTIKQSELYDFLYYDIITDTNAYNTFKICIKYIKPSISSKDWWIQRLKYVLNGIFSSRGRRQLWNNQDLSWFFRKISNITYQFECLEL